MKKITLFLAALAVTFSASAGSVLGVGYDGAWFNKTTGEFYEEGDPALAVPGDLPQNFSIFRSVTFAVQVKDATLLNWLTDGGYGDANGRWLFYAPSYYYDYQIVDYRVVNFNDRWDNRLYRYENTNIFYMDIVAATLFTNVLNIGSPFEKPYDLDVTWLEALADVGNIGSDAMYFNHMVSWAILSMNGDFFPAQLKTDGTTTTAGTPAVEFDPWNGTGKPDFVKTYNVAIDVMNDLDPKLLRWGSRAGEASFDPNTNPFDGTVGNGIAEILADEQNADIVAFYSIMGMKLADEPEKGLFIVKFSNGKSVKILK